MKDELRIPRTDREDYYLEYINLLEEKLKKDSLTGLLNAKTFLSSSREEGYYLFIDLDNVKLLNDEYQDHQLGTAAIRAAGYVLQNDFEEFRSCRYGGDEFLMFVPTSLSQGEYIARFILDKISNAKIDSFYRGHNPIPDWTLTCSIGIGKTIEEADRALYQAKSQGKNRICKGMQND